MEAELKLKLTKAKRQLLAMKAKLGDATAARDAALAQLQVSHLVPADCTARL